MKRYVLLSVSLFCILVQSHFLLAGDDKLCNFDVFKNTIGDHLVPGFSFVSHNDCATKAFNDCEGVLQLEECRVLTNEEVLKTLPTMPNWRTGMDSATVSTWQCYATGKRKKELSSYKVKKAICGIVDECIFSCVNNSSSTKDQLDKLKLLSDIKKCEDRDDDEALLKIDRDAEAYLRNLEEASVWLCVLNSGNDGIVGEGYGLTQPQAQTRAFADCEAKSRALKVSFVCQEANRGVGTFDLVLPGQSINRGYSCDKIDKNRVPAGKL